VVGTVSLILLMLSCAQSHFHCSWLFHASTTGLMWILPRIVPVELYSGVRTDTSMFRFLATADAGVASCSAVYNQMLFFMDMGTPCMGHLTWIPLSLLNVASPIARQTATGKFIPPVQRNSISGRNLVLKWILFSMVIAKRSGTSPLAAAFLTRLILTNAQSSHHTSLLISLQYDRQLGHHFCPAMNPATNQLPKSHPTPLRSLAM